MPRRVSLPAADDLFRRTVPGGEQAVVRAVPNERVSGERVPEGRGSDDGKRKPSGRVRHDEKMTVYVTSAELLDLEHARLRLRAEQGLAVDRGRLVREALALVLADFATHGEDSVLVRRLTEE